MEFSIQQQRVLAKLKARRVIGVLQRSELQKRASIKSTDLICFGFDLWVVTCFVSSS